VALREAVHALTDARTPPWTRFPSPFQLSIQQLHSDGAPLVVPDRATARCHVTFAPPFTLAQMRDRLRSEVAAFESHVGLDRAVSIDWSGFATEPVSSNADVLARTI